MSSPNSNDQKKQSFQIPSAPSPHEFWDSAMGWMLLGLMLGITLAIVFVIAWLFKIPIAFRSKETCFGICPEFYARDNDSSENINETRIEPAPTSTVSFDLNSSISNESTVFLATRGNVTLLNLDRICQGQENLVLPYAATYYLEKDLNRRVLTLGTISFNNNNCSQGEFQDYSVVLVPGGGITGDRWRCQGSVTYDSPARLTWKSIVRERCADNIVHRFTTFQE